MLACDKNIIYLFQFVQFGWFRHLVRVDYDTTQLLLICIWTIYLKDLNFIHTNTCNMYHVTQ